MNSSCLAFVSKNVFIAVICLTIGVYSGENNCEQRNVTAASIQGHICQNSCGTKRDCLSAVRICVCDGICGKSCVRTHLKCQKPKNPNNGMVHSTSLRYNSVITYTCNQGYKLIGNDSRVCRGHGKWDKQPPTCEKYDKSSVEKSLSNTTENLDEDTEFHTNQETSKYNKNRTTSKTSHVTVSTNSKLFETTSVSSPDIDSSVLIGEISSGEDNEDPKVPKIDKKFIGGGIWDIRQNSNNTESSIPQVSVTESLYNAKELGRFLDKVTALGGDKECLDPPKITNSIMTGKNAGYVIDTEMEYKCNYGFYVAPEINGRRIITKTRCIQNVENNSVFWTELNMICRKKSCSDPGDILRGSRIGYVFTVGNEVKYTCDEGYKMIGRPVIFCTPSAKWNRSPPKCQAYKCRIPENLENGIARYDSVDYLSIVSYTCSKSYTLIGNNERKCLANKTWSGQAPTCQVVQCEPPEFLLNGKIEVGTGPILTGYIITFRCNIRNILIGSSTSRCLEDGNWSFQLPECKATCVSVIVANGEVFVRGDKMAPGESTTEHGEKETIVCDEGYQVSNTFDRSSELQCVSGNWFPPDECIPASCDMFEIYDLRPSDSRLVNPPSTSKAENNAEIQLKCRNGHIPSSNTYHALICHFGEWNWLNDQELTCTPIQCVVNEEDIDGKNYKNMFVGKIVSHNEVLDIKCRDNYQISDDNAETIHCKLGKFSPNNLPKCNPKMCATFKVENGLDVTEAVHGTTTEIQCYEDYIVDGSNSVLCQFGSWMPYIPSCIKDSICTSNLCEKSVNNTRAKDLIDKNFCRYYPSDHLNVYSDVIGGKEVINPLKVPSGTTVTSRCINKTYLKPHSGTSSSKCHEGTWIPDKPLSCQDVEDGDISTPFYANYQGSFLHSADGVITMKKGYPLQLFCSIKNGKKMPVWSTNAVIKYGYSSMCRLCDKQNMKFVTIRYVMYETHIEQALISYPLFTVDEDSSIMYEIREISHGNEGIYRCFKTNNEYSNVRVRVVEKFRCPEKVPWQSVGLRVQFNRRRVGSMAYFSCEKGYNLEGDESVVCNNQYLWESHNSPHCIRIQRCQKPDIQNDSNLRSSNVKDHYSLGERVTFSCSNNFKIKNSYQTIQCTLFGWNKDVPTCIQGCQRPNISQSSNVLISNDKEAYFVGERLRFSCQNNYKIQERYQVIYCLPNGWNKSVPTCILDEEKG